MHHTRNLIFVAAVILLLAGGVIVATVSYLNSRQRAVPIVFSDYAMLSETYKAYLDHNLDAGSGRTIDKSNGDITTSEGESYTMLRAVYMDDKSTFDKSWQFTENNMQRSDKLFDWKYGSLGNGKYGILTGQGGNNTASDADEDIALSLLMAYRRWNQTAYLKAAQPIITSIWQEEVVSVDGQPVLTADNIERQNVNLVVDPSYFAPANYKIFALIDPSHNWSGLAANSYNLLRRLSMASLGASKSDGLPPDWVEINRYSGDFIANASSTLDANFGYDAMRIPFRLALDYNWFKDSRDKQVLSQFGFLKQFWQNTNVLNATYAHDGSVVASYESPAIYGGVIGYFDVMDPTDAKQIYQTKLQTLYSPDQQAWKAPAPGYYEDNWAWFGMALTQGALHNISEGE